MTFFERSQTNARAPPQLLGTLGGDINEQKPALDCRRGIDRFRGSVIVPRDRTFTGEYHVNGTGPSA